MYGIYTLVTVPGYPLLGIQIGIVSIRLRHAVCNASLLREPATDSSSFLTLTYISFLKLFSTSNRMLVRVGRKSTNPLVIRRPCYDRHPYIPTFVPSIAPTVLSRKAVVNARWRP